MKNGTIGTLWAAIGCCAAACMGGPALGQSGFPVDLSIDDGDPSFASRPSFHYEALEVTLNGAVPTVSISGSTPVDYYLSFLPSDYDIASFGPGSGPSLRGQPETFGYVVLSGDGSAVPTDGANPDPLGAGAYLLVVAPNTTADTVLTLSVDEGVLGWGPTVQEAFAVLAASATPLSVNLVGEAGRVTGAQARSSLARRLGRSSQPQTLDQAEDGLQTTRSTRSGVPATDRQSGLNTWIEVTGFRAEDDSANRTYRGRGLQFGADLALAPDMVAGLSFGIQELDFSVGAISQDGILRFVQSYLAYRSGAWSGEASLIYGQGEQTQTSIAGTGTVETRLSALTFTGGYDIALSNAAVLTPTIGLVHGLERIEGLTGTLAGAGTENVRFTEASFGAQISRSIAGGEIFGGLHADWLSTSAETALAQTLLVDDGWTGRVVLGISTDLANGFALDSSIELSGLGGDLRNTSGALRFTIRF